jgi:hypothetical protein
MLDEGAIVEEGTYLELLESGRHFSKLMYQFGGATEKKAEEEEEVEEEAIDEVVLSSVAPGEEARPVFQIRKSTFQSGEKAQGGRLAEGTGKIEVCRSPPLAVRRLTLEHRLRRASSLSRRRATREVSRMPFTAVTAKQAMAPSCCR